MMSNEEITELGKTHLAGLFEAGQFDEKTRKRMLVAFAQGFLAGEIRQINKRVNELMK